jgi:hypothetical protein
LARNGSGTFTMPNTFTPSTTILSSDVNENNTDIANELTNSLALDGQSTMTGQIKAASGTVGAPGWSFSADLDCGFYRIGANNIGLALNGAKVVDFSTTGVAITGTLAASGNVAINTDKFTVAAATGNTVVAGTLGVTGNTTLSGTLAVTGAATLSSTLSATDITGSGAISGATVTGSMVSTQAQAEAALSTTTVLTPGRAQYHPGVAKAWGHVTVSGGTPALALGHNVASITDNGVGNYTINLTTAFSAANFAVVAIKFDPTGTGTDVGEIVVDAITTTTIRIRSFTSTSTTQTTRIAADISFMFMAFGDQ